jgi:carboxylesterase type B
MVSTSTIAIGVLAVIATLASTQDPPTVQLKNGTYSGIYDAIYNQNVFLGMPFAEPPVGPLRFRVPQPLETAWNDTRPGRRLWEQLSSVSYIPKAANGKVSLQRPFAFSQPCLRRGLSHC